MNDFELAATPTLENQEIILKQVPMGQVHEDNLNGRETTLAFENIQAASMLHAASLAVGNTVEKVSEIFDRAPRKIVAGIALAAGVLGSGAMAIAAPAHNQTKSFSQSSAANALKKKIDKCGGIGRVGSININSQTYNKTTRDKQFSSVSGRVEVVDGHQQYKWKFKRGYKLCALVSKYDFTNVDQWIQFPAPTKNNRKSGMLKDKADLGSNSIQSLNVYAQRIK